MTLIKPRGVQLKVNAMTSMRRYQRHVVLASMQVTSNRKHQGPVSSTLIPATLKRRYSFTYA